MDSWVRHTNDEVETQDKATQRVRGRGGFDLELQAPYALFPPMLRHFRWLIISPTLTLKGSLLPQSIIEGAEKRGHGTATSAPHDRAPTLPPLHSTILPFLALDKSHAVPSSRYSFPCPVLPGVANSYPSYETQTEWHLPPEALSDFFPSPLEGSFWLFLAFKRWSSLV